MEDIIIREDVVNGICLHLQEQLENSVKQKKIKLEHYDKLYFDIRDLSISGVINDKERNEIHAQLKTMFCDVFRKMGLEQNNIA